MRGRLGVLIGFGAGYVLGAKAGHERYEQLRRLYNNVISSPGFQEASGRAREAVEQGLEQAKGLATEGVHKVTDTVRERGDGGSGLTVAPPPHQ